MHKYTYITLAGRIFIIQANEAVNLNSVANPSLIISPRGARVIMSPPPPSHYCGAALFAAAAASHRMLKFMRNLINPLSRLHPNIKQPLPLDVASRSRCL